MATEPGPGPGPEPELKPDDAVPTIKQPRAYQLELFDASMKRNVIVTVRDLLSLGQIFTKCADDVMLW